jgi:glycosyltransferase, family 1
MNILYVSCLLNNKATGLYWSVPQQIAAQARYDHVFWYNINHNSECEWQKIYPCHTIDEYPYLRLKDLPSPFNAPDLVIFESFYEYAFSKLVYEIWRKNIPYIIVPRCSLTKEAQRIKRLKKRIGNFLFFSKFARKALAIQYLTENEYVASGDKWNGQHIIIANGIDTPGEIHRVFGSTLHGLFIGRIAVYHKGLDLLVDACSKMQDELRQAGCTIRLYGPDWDDDESKLRKRVQERGVADIILLGNGPVYEDEKRNLLLRYDFFVLTSRLEGHPMALIEALSYGLPAVVTEGSNMADEIRTYNAGWESVTTVEGIAGSLRRLIKERVELSLKSQNAILLSKQYNWKSLACDASEKYAFLLRKKC